jgi:hypothetical protein
LIAEVEALMAQNRQFVEQLVQTMQQIGSLSTSCSGTCWRWTP